MVLFLTPLLIFQIDLAYATPTLDSKFPLTAPKKIPTSGENATMQINNVSISSSKTDLLLVGVTLGNFDVRPDTIVSSVTCGAKTLQTVPGSISQGANQTRNEFFYATEVAGPCNVVITFSQPQGFVTTGTVAIAPATASALVFSGVNQTAPVKSIATKNVTSGPLISLPITNVKSTDLVVDLFSGNKLSPTISTASVKGANQNSTHQTQFPFLGGNFRMGISVQSGSAGLDPMSWDVKEAGLYSMSAILIQSCGTSCIVSLVSTSGSQGSCGGDCTPPTLGIDKNNKRVVSDGFAFNDNFSDVDLYYTLYPLITAYVGEENSISLRLFENSGPDNIAHVGLAFGLGEGESFNDSEAIINWDRSFDGTEKISLIDPYNVLDNVRVESQNVDCELIDNVCFDIVFYFTFRAPLEFNMVSTNIWDHDRNAWQNYFNHGFQVIGDSLNDPMKYTGIYKGKIFSLTETGKNKSVDQNGNTWTFDKGIWERDYVAMKKTDPELVNSEKIWAIKHTMKDNYLNDISEITLLKRDLVHFVIAKDYEILLAESMLEEMCPKCTDDPFEEIDDIFYYDLPVPTERITSSLNSTMTFESQKASESLQKMFSLYYPGKVND
ncbi:hypothetical protein [Nitrosopumilus sp. S4]